MLIRCWKICWSGEIRPLQLWNYALLLLLTAYMCFMNAKPAQCQTSGWSGGSWVVCDPNGIAPSYNQTGRLTIYRDRHSDDYLRQLWRRQCTLSGSQRRVLALYRRLCADWVLLVEQRLWPQRTY
jgi:hypothetical protein